MAAGSHLPVQQCCYLTAKDVNECQPDVRRFRRHGMKIIRVDFASAGSTLQNTWPSGTFSFCTRALDIASFYI